MVTDISQIVKSLDLTKYLWNEKYDPCIQDRISKVEDLIFLLNEGYIGDNWDYHISLDIVPAIMPHIAHEEIFALKSAFYGLIASKSPSLLKSEFSEEHGELTILDAYERALDTLNTEKITE
jgi:hypothetical protein